MTTNPFLDLTTIQTLLGRPLTPTETARATLDLGALIETVSNWLSYKLVETTITDERHYVAFQLEPIRTKWRPVKSYAGIKLQRTTNPMITTYNEAPEDLSLARGEIYFVTYTTDASETADYADTLKRIFANAIIGSTLKADVVRYGVLNSYSIEGTSISYNTGTTDADSVGSIPGTDLRSIGTLRRRIFA